MTKAEKILNFIEKHYDSEAFARLRSLETSSSLDIGCGRSPKNPFKAKSTKGLDIVAEPGTNIIKCDLFTQGFPFDDGNFQFITAFDFVEHVPRVFIDMHGTTRFRVVEIMQEVHRCLDAGGLFFSFTPAYPSEAAFRDPTHVNIITTDTFPMYFCVNNKKRPEAYRYGFTGAFRLIAQELSGSHLLTLLEKNII